MDALQTFVVRIYRRGAGTRIAGTVERVANGKTSAFRSFKELRQVLQDPLRLHLPKARGKA